MSSKYQRGEPGRPKKKLSRDIKEEIAHEILVNKACKDKICKAYGINYTQLICIVGEYQINALEDTVAQLRAENKQLQQENESLKRQVLRLNIMNNNEEGVK